MRSSVAADSLIERIGLLLGRVPRPVGSSFNGMPTARGVGVAQKLGVFAALALAPAGSDELAARLGAQPDMLRMLLDLLTGERLLTLRDGRYDLSREGRRWLDPASSTYVGTFLEHTLDYWPWWGDLERMLREGGHIDFHSMSVSDPAWRVYIRGQYELARLSAGDVARALKLDSQARSLLDLAGGHGWFAAALCRRHPGLRATVVDLPGSVAVGREIMRETGMDGVVTHVVGDMFEADLGGPHDAVLLFSILHHLTPVDRVRLLARVRSVLRPGGVVAVLDMFRPEPGARRRASAAIFELFFRITSGSDVPSHGELLGWLGETGFGSVRRVDLRTLPDLRLYRGVAV